MSIKLLLHYKTIPWQILDQLQICYDEGDDNIKKATLKAAQLMDYHLKKMESIWTSKDCKNG